MQALTELVLNWIPNSKNQIQSITSQLYIYYKKFQSYSKCSAAFCLHPREYIKHPELSLKKQSMVHWNALKINRSLKSVTLQADT